MVNSEERKKNPRLGWMEGYVGLVRCTSGLGDKLKMIMYMKKKDNINLLVTMFIN